MVTNLQVGHTTQMAVTSNVPCNRCGHPPGVLVQVRYYAKDQAAQDGDWTYAEVCMGCLDALKRDNRRS